ncbi:MAG: GNAT family N-acetyltransferase [Elainella sp.]
MQLQRFNTAQDFWQNNRVYLAKHEAEHNAMLGIVQTLLQYPERYSEPTYLAVVRQDQHVLAVAIQTPSDNLMLSRAEDLTALQLIAQDLESESLPGVCGLVAETAAFVQIWQNLTGQPAQPGPASRIYQLTQVEPVTQVKGSLRLASLADWSLLLPWLKDFDAGIGVTDAAETESRLTLHLKRQSLYLWEDGLPVSLVGGRQFTATAARIAPVYTPPEHRGRGYATAGVAALSQKLLDQGCNRCYLFTDLANPTSNHIYQQVGYRPVCDWRDYLFNSPKSSSSPKPIV